MAPKPRPAVDRFVEKFEVLPNGCHEWRAARYSNGYGAFGFGRRKGDGKMGNVLAHRFAYTQFVGPIPTGMEIDHLCRNPACVNPAHLEVVTPRENQLRSESVSGRAARRTNCPQGHPYDAENTHIRPTGARQCKACNRETSRLAQLRKTARDRAIAQGVEVPPWAIARR